MVSFSLLSLVGELEKINMFENVTNATKLDRNFKPLFFCIFDINFFACLISKFMQKNGINAKQWHIFFLNVYDILIFFSALFSNFLFSFAIFLTVCHCLGQFQINFRENDLKHIKKRILTVRI